MRAVAAEGYDRPTSVQSSAIPAILEGRDVLARAQTGTGKTAAFVLPLIQRLKGPRRDAPVRVLILAPTRELAQQIADRTTAYGRYARIRSFVIYGGVSQRPQAAALRERRVDVLIATPGRLVDLMQQGLVDLRRVESFVLDEADRMLDMGFIHDVKKIVRALPQSRQTLLFSATLVPAIDALAKTLLVDPACISIDKKVEVADTVKQSVAFVAQTEKSRLLEQMLLSEDVERAIVFTRTKRGASRLSALLERKGILSDAIHGNKSQGARNRTLGAFRTGETRVLIATDVAARGLDVEGISHVINYDMPTDAESYVHRIGRTGRAGAEGRAISFCDRGERALLANIERFIRRRLDVEGGGASVPSESGPVASSPGESRVNEWAARRRRTRRGSAFRPRAAGAR